MGMGEPTLEQPEALSLNMYMSDSHLVIGQIERETGLPFSL